MTARVTGLPVPRAYVVTGLWLNALIPPAFFLCARRLIGDWPALAALCAFLFLPGRAPAWAAATYSPWLFPSVTAQIPFYAAVWAWVGTLGRPEWWRMAGAGALLGVTFLAHSAPALVLGGIMLLTTCMTVGSRWRVHAAAAVLKPTLAYGVALMIASPFLLPVATTYGFHTLNREPARWIYEAAQPGALLSGFARPSALVNLLAVVAGVAWIRRSVSREKALVLASWAVVSAVGLAYCLAAEQWERLPAVVSAFHFLFLLRSVTWLAFGCGLNFVVDVLMSRARRRDGRRLHTTHANAALIVLLILALYPRYLGREAFAKAPAIAEQVLSDDERQAYQWIRGNTDRSAVFLASDGDALRIVGPAGRYVVSVQPFFSNPYVDYRQRAAARDAILGAALTGDGDVFERLRAPFGVSHVVVRAEQGLALRSSAAWLSPVHSRGDITIFEVAGRR